MSYAKRRELLREATGPTEEEFASEGATFLVGMVRAAFPDRLMPEYKVTPRDDWFWPYAYVDDIGVKVGELLGEVLDQETSPEVARQIARRQLRAQRQAERRERRTAQASTLFARWAAREGAEINGTWTVPNEKGHGILIDAENEFTLRAVQEKARELARLTRTYYSIVPAENPGEYLVAFVTEARYVPMDFASAVAIADTMTDATTPVVVDKSVPGEVTVLPDTEEAHGLVGALGYAPTVGNIFQKLKESLESKKPEKIKKKIDRLEAELTRLKAKLAEVEGESSEGIDGMVVGNIYGADTSMMRRFRAAETQDYDDAYQPGMFSSASRFSGDYGELHDPRMFDEAEQGLADYGELGDDEFTTGALPMARMDLEAEVLNELRDAVAEGDITQAQMEALVDRFDTMSNEDLMELYQDLVGDDEAGFISDPGLTSSTATMSKSSKRKMRRQRRRQRRRDRRQRRRSRRAKARRMSRRQRRRSRRRASKSKGPKIIVIRQGGGDGGGGGGDVQYIDGDGGDEGGDYDDEDDYDEDDDGSDGVGAFAYGGPGYGDAALRMARNVDLPRSPGGYVINYPVG